MADDNVVAVKGDVTHPKINEWKVLQAAEYQAFKTNVCNYLLGEVTKQRPYEWVSNALKPKLRTKAMGAVDVKYRSEAEWTKLDGKTFWVVCDKLFPAKRSMGDLTSFIRTLDRPQLAMSAPDHEGKMEPILEFVTKIEKYLGDNKIHPDTENEHAVREIGNKLPNAIKHHLMDAVQKVIDESDRVDPETKRDLDDYHVLGTVTLALAMMCMEENVHGMKALMAFGPSIDKSKQASRKGAKEDEPSKRNNRGKGNAGANTRNARRNQNRSEEEVPKRIINCFQCGDEGHLSTECTVEQQTAKGKAAQDAAAEKRPKNSRRRGAK